MSYCFRIGIFKGQKLGWPVFLISSGGKNLPGLLQIHGGGQYADYKAALTNGKRGYATLSIAWAGRISAPNYRVSPSEVKLFGKIKKMTQTTRLLQIGEHLMHIMHRAVMVKMPFLRYPWKIGQSIPWNLHGIIRGFW